MYVLHVCTSAFSLRACVRACVRDACACVITFDVLSVVLSVRFLNNCVLSPASFNICIFDSNNKQYSLRKRVFPSQHRCHTKYMMTIKNSLFP